MTLSCRCQQANPRQPDQIRYDVWFRALAATNVRTRPREKWLGNGRPSDISRQMSTLIGRRPLRLLPIQHAVDELGKDVYDDNGLGSRLACDRKKATFRNADLTIVARLSLT